MLALDGYYKDGSFFALDPPAEMANFRRVIITVLDESIREKKNSWADLDALVDTITDKPRLADFPRAQLSRPLLFAEEAT